VTGKADSADTREGRRQLLLIALVFVLPLAAAAWLYFDGNGWRPAHSTNHGALLSPIVELRESLRTSPLQGQIGRNWALIYVNEGPCDDGCRDALYKLRQSRLMLGKDMNRLVRVFLHGSEAPDTVFLDRGHGGLIALHDADFSNRLVSLRPQPHAGGGYYLLDPLCNLVMYFPADIVPRDMVDDLSHLLKLSRIG
jgi:hypothetical protein